MEADVDQLPIGDRGGQPVGELLPADHGKAFADGGEAVVQVDHPVGEGHLVDAIAVTEQPFQPLGSRRVGRGCAGADEDVAPHGEHVAALQEGAPGRGKVRHGHGCRWRHDRAACTASFRFLDDGAHAEAFLEAGRQPQGRLDDPVTDDDHGIAHERLHAEPTAVQVQFAVGERTGTVHAHTSRGEEAGQSLDLLDAAFVAPRIGLRPELPRPSGHVLSRTFGEEAEGGGDSCGEFGREGEVDDPAYDGLLQYTPVMGDVGDRHESGSSTSVGRVVRGAPSAARRCQKSSRCSPA